MSDFQVRSDAVDVEQIMRQIRARIREKRGADYTEQEIRELASVKLEKFLDPRGVRSNLVEEFRRNRVVSPAPAAIVIETLTVSGTHRSALASIRRMLQPVMKLFINPVSIVHDVNAAVQKIATTQTTVNEDFHRRFRQREEMDPLYYEVIHNVVVELTRLSIENSNLKMRVESLSSRMDFDERRSRALETVVQYKPAPRPGHTEKPQNDRPDRSQSDRSNPDRSQSDRSNQDRSQGDRSSNQEKAQQNRSQNQQNQPPAQGGEKAQTEGQPAQGQPAQSADPQRAGLESRDQGERGERRRRRRRRRRPGQNAASAGGPGGAAQNGSQQAGDADGDYDGPDDGNDVNESEGADEAPRAETASSNAPAAQSIDAPAPTTSTGAPTEGSHE